MASNEQLIWDLLMKAIHNPYGVAAVMGNLMAESSLNPMNMTGTKAKQWSNKNEYFNAVNLGTYDQFSFAHDGIAVGLAQWLYWSRKQALHEFAKGRDIGSVEVQIGYLLKELPSYKTVWNALLTAVDIQTPCDTFMLKYEKPGTTTEAAKQKRRNYAMKYFDKYYEPVAPDDPSPAPVPEPIPDIPKSKRVATTMSNVLVRCGNGKEFSTIGKILDQGTSYPWVATSENSWHAIKFHDRVGWISGSFSKIVES